MLFKNDVPQYNARARAYQATDVVQRCEFNFNTRSQSCMECEGEWQVGGGGGARVNIKVPQARSVQDARPPLPPPAGIDAPRHAYTSLTHNLDARLREWTSPVVRAQSIPRIQDYISARILR